MGGTVAPIVVGCLGTWAVSQTVTKNRLYYHVVVLYLLTAFFLIRAVDEYGLQNFIITTSSVAQQINSIKKFCCSHPTPIAIEYIVSATAQYSSLPLIGY